MGEIEPPCKLIVGLRLLPKREVLLRGGVHTARF